MRIELTSRYVHLAIAGKLLPEHRRGIDFCIYTCYIIIRKSEIQKNGGEDMIATIRKRSQITLPSEIITKLGLNEGDQLDVVEHNGTIVLFPMSVYPTKYIEDLKKEVSDIKSKIASGEQPTFDSVDALFESLEK